MEERCATSDSQTFPTRQIEIKDNNLIALGKSFGFDSRETRKSFLVLWRSEKMSFLTKAMLSKAKQRTVETREQKVLSKLFRINENYEIFSCSPKQAGKACGKLFLAQPNQSLLRKLYGERLLWSWKVDNKI